jgi:cardiolipin synthase
MLVEQEQVVPTKTTEKIKSRVDPDAASAQIAGETLAPVGTPDNPSSQIFTIANVITFCRLLLTLAFLWLFVSGTDRTLALICYAIAAVTDFLDGMVARATNTVSWLGKVMDPLMDRVLLFIGVLGLVITGELPVWVAVFVIGRDLIILGGGIALQRYRHRPIDVVFIGKVTTALFMFGFCLLLLGQPELPGLGLATTAWLPGFGSAPYCVGIWFVYVGVITSTITLVIYMREALFFRREALAGHDVESADSNRRARKALNL